MQRLAMKCYTFYAAIDVYAMTEDEAQRIVDGEFNNDTIVRNRELWIDSVEEIEPANITPPAVIAAFQHVRRYHPTVDQLWFGETGEWTYFDSVTGHAPAFGAEIDTNILSAAADATHEQWGFPQLYHYPTE